MKYSLKEQAIALRREGLTYREILKQVPVAKSTLSKWLHSVGLAKHEIQRLTEKKLAAGKRGGQARHQQRIDKTKEILDKARSEIGTINKREMWLMGIMLYWAEGSKEKFHAPSTSVQFTNMDPLMICLFIQWLKTACNINKKDLIYDIYIHKTHKYRVPEIIEFWSKQIRISSDHFSHIYFKNSPLRTNRKNRDLSYFGVIKLKVRSSVSLNRKIAGWTQGVVESFR